MFYVVGELDVPLSRFWSMTIVEVQLKIEGNLIRNERNIYDPLRMLISKIHNVNISKKSDAIKPKDVFPLNIDKLQVRDLEKEFKEAKEYVSKMLKNGRHAKGITSQN